MRVEYFSDTDTTLMELTGNEVAETREPHIMKIRALLLVVALVSFASVAAAATPSAGCGKSGAASGAVTIDVAGEERRFTVRLPAKDDGMTPLPVVFVFHPFGSSPEEMEAATGLAGAWPRAVAIYPEGLPRTAPWSPDARQTGWQISPGELGDRDLELFDHMVEWVEKSACVDTSRLYAIGHSNGAFFSHLLGCRRPDVLAAIAPAAGGIFCKPSKPVPVILSHGAADQAVPYEAATDAAQVWAVKNGCKPAPPPKSSGCHAQQGCGTNDVVLCRHEGRHGYDPDFTARAVELFERHTRP